MDPRFTYPAHIPRHGFNMQVHRPSYAFVNLVILTKLERLPQKHHIVSSVYRDLLIKNTHLSFSPQHRMVEGHHMGPRYPMGPDPNQQQPPHQHQHPYMGPTHGPSLGPRPMGLQPGPPPEASMYPAHHRPEGHNVHPMANRFSGPDGPPQHNYPGLRHPGMGLPNMWTGMNPHERPNGMHVQDPNMVNQRNFSYGGVPPPVGHKPWPEAAGYPHPLPNGQYQMSAAVSSPGPMSSCPPGPHADASGRTRLVSMLDSPEMLALQQLSASSGPPAGSPHQHMGNFQQAAPPSGVGSVPSGPSQQQQQPPSAPEVQLLHPAANNGPDSQPSQQPDTQPKGRADLLSVPQPAICVLHGRTRAQSSRFLCSALSCL